MSGIMVCGNCDPMFTKHENGMKFCANCRSPVDQETIDLCAAWEEETGRTVYDDGTSIRDVKPVGQVLYDPPPEEN